MVTNDRNKNDFSYFISMALQKTMPWTTLAILLKDLAPTLNETWEIISILLKELESLQSVLEKKHELKKHRDKRWHYASFDKDFHQPISENDVKIDESNGEKRSLDKVVEGQEF